MDARRKILMIFLFCTTYWIYGQDHKEPLFPKDTVFIKYSPIEEVNGSSIDPKTDYIYKGKEGLKFWWDGKWLFHPINYRTDIITQCEARNIHFSNMKEIEEKAKKWIDEKYSGLKYKPYGGPKNPIFVIYLLEETLGNQYMLYEVIFMNEGAIP